MHYCLGTFQVLEISQFFIEEKAAFEYLTEKGIIATETQCLVCGKWTKIDIQRKRIRHTCNRVSLESSMWECTF
jgi:hypothetical protein